MRNFSPRMPIVPPFLPMEATSVDEIPRGDFWQYEPKWDGFRCLAFRETKHVELQSKTGKPLTRYFPEVVERLRRMRTTRFVLDGELIVPRGQELSFDALLQRIHPAESRILKLSHESPALFVAFDQLVTARGTSLADRPLAERRQHLESYFERVPPESGLWLSPSTGEFRRAQRWYKEAGGSTDGVMAKRLDFPYRSGLRDGMVKVKPRRTVDCVVGGFRYASHAPVVGSLLLGLFDREGLLDHVGFTSNFGSEDRQELTARLERMKKPPGFTGRKPGRPSRWSTDRAAQWLPVAPRLVLEVAYDQMTNERFRHGVTFLRWRPDKAPEDCTFDQLAASRGGPLRLLRKNPKR